MVHSGGIVWSIVVVWYIVVVWCYSGKHARIPGEKCVSPRLTVSPMRQAGEARALAGQGARISCAAVPSY